MLLKLKEVVIMFYEKRTEILRYNLKFLLQLNDNGEKQL